MSATLAQPELSQAHLYLSELSKRDTRWDGIRAVADTVGQMYTSKGLVLLGERIIECSPTLRFRMALDPETGIQSLKLHTAHFCRVRHCPVCQWRREMMWRARFFKKLPSIIGDYPTARFLFLTLTVRNCSIDSLRETLKEMNGSWKRLTKRKEFPALGWVKTVEVTRGQDGDAHPHFHVLLMVKSSYFSHGYISQQRWRELWREAMRIDYDPSVRVTAVRNIKENVPREALLTEASGYAHSNNGVASDMQKSQEIEPDYAHSSAEVVANAHYSQGEQKLAADLVRAVRYTLKYSVKPEQLVLDEDWLVALTEQLHKTRAIALGGVFKQYLSEDEPDDLIHSDEITTSDDVDEDNDICFGWRSAIARYTLQHDSDYAHTS